MTILVTIASVVLLGIHPNVLYLILIVIPSPLVFSSLGARLCVLVGEVFEAQALLNLPRFSMIFLSGVVYPVSSMPVTLQYLAHIMPLTYTVDGLRQSFSASPNMMVSTDGLVLTAFFILFIFPAIKLFYKKFE